MARNGGHERGGTATRAASAHAGGPGAGAARLHTHAARRAAVASAGVVGLGALWGIYWIPLRQLHAADVAGGWATLVPVAVGLVCLAPLLRWRRGGLAAADRRGLACTALGGVSLVAYSNGLVYGQVAVVILLFYLTPVWSALIDHLWFGRSVSRWRYAAMGCGLLGIGLVLHGAYGGVPLPRTLGDLLGLASGLLWSIASTGIFAHSRIRPPESAFVFCVGGAAVGLVLALVLDPEATPTWATVGSPSALGWIVLMGGLWWAGATSVLMWANQVLDAPRIGILFMGEAIVGAASAALLTDEPFGSWMALGAVLVIAAGALEAGPDGYRRARTRP